MPIQTRVKIGSLSRLNSFYSLVNPLCTQKPYLPKSLTPTIQMVTESGPTKRHMCPQCSKPTQICLCTRLKNPALENSIAVTILQHDLEKKHPLNSTRIATMGLKNVNIVYVSDINFQAQFFIHLLEPNQNLGSDYLEGKIRDFVENGSGKRKWDFVENPVSLCGFKKSSDFEGFLGSPEEESSDFAEEGIDRSNLTKSSSQGIDPNGAVSGGSEDALVAFTIEKYGTIKSFNSHWMLPEPHQCQEKNNFDQLLASKAAMESLAKGFAVKKLQTKQLNGTVNLEEFEEFEVNIPPGSILLFPSEKSVGIEAIDFEVKNLIVLDGTWAKAKRMYNENPWLKLLPHLKLDLEKLSLYSEVRHQPKAGCLSTIESIVYALKALSQEEDYEKLDHLLDVFESMVADQRRCKDERLSRLSEKPLNS